MAEMSHLVSVAMCTFNGAQYLEEQLASISGQSVLPGELVVRDDGSGDATMDILTIYKTQAPFPVRIFSNTENLGVIRNIEKAVGICAGEYVLLADQDDIWLV